MRLRELVASAVRNSLVYSDSFRFNNFIQYDFFPFSDPRGESFSNRQRLKETERQIDQTWPETVRAGLLLVSQWMDMSSQIRLVLL